MFTDSINKRQGSSEERLNVTFTPAPLSGTTSLEYARRLQGLKRSCDSRRTFIQQHTSANGSDSSNDNSDRVKSVLTAVQRRRALINAREKYSTGESAVLADSNNRLAHGGVASRLYDTYSYNTSQEQVGPENVVFRDSESVGTGLSQQELLRQKARTDKKKKYGKKKTREQRIINFPSALLSAAKPVSPRFLKNNSKEYAVFSSQHLTAASPAETAQNTTTESEATASSLFSRGAYKVSREAATAAANEASYVANSATIYSSERSSLSDTRSVGEESFPLLSTSASDGLIESQILEFSILENINNTTTSSSSTRPKSNSSRSVSFSSNVDQSTFYVEDGSENPSDETTDNASPTSVVRPIAIGDSNVKPVSILRKSRFGGNINSKPQVTTRQYVSSYNEGKSASYITAITKNTNAAVVVSSTPQPIKYFVDIDGRSLSPIQSMQSVEDNTQTGKTKTKKTVEFDPQILTEKVKRSQVMAISDQSIDDDSTVFSTRKSFLEAVAAVVIQTAVRRYLATQFVMYMIEQQRQQQNQQQEEYKSVPKYCEPSFQSRFVQAAVEQKSSKKRHIQPAKPREVKNEIVHRTAPPMQRRDQDIEAIAQQMYIVAAVRIQSMFRGFWARDCLNVDHFCATIVQKYARRYICENRYFDTVHRIIIVQSVVRRYLAHEYAADMIACSMVIQAFYRGYRVRKRVNIRRVNEIQRHEAAVIIQSQWRAYSTEMAYVQDLVDVMIVQGQVRVWLAKRKLAALKMCNADASLEDERSFDTRPRFKVLQSHKLNGTKSSSDNTFSLIPTNPRVFAGGHDNSTKSTSYQGASSDNKVISKHIHSLKNLTGVQHTAQANISDSNADVEVLGVVESRTEDASTSYTHDSSACSQSNEVSQYTTDYSYHEKPSRLDTSELLFGDFDSRESCSGVTSISTEGLEDTVEQLIADGLKQTADLSERRTPIDFYRQKVINTLNEAYDSMLNDLNENKTSRNK